MNDTFSASDATALAATTADWLVGSGLDNTDVSQLVSGLCRRLNAGGLAVDRGGCAILALHPQIVSQEMTWRSDDDMATARFYTPNEMEDPENRRGPYFDLALNRTSYRRFYFGEQGAWQEMPLLARLQAEGFTEYLGFFHPTGGVAVTPFARRIGLAPCVAGSFATRQAGGFGDAGIACLQAISKTLALAAKSRTNFETASRFLDLYVGQRCGSQVLDGRITRGDSDRISCGIWFCDLRQSSRLIAELSLDDYITLLNRYFDLTVGAVMGEGGEVLKFIGDAVMGIFHSDRPDSDRDMRERALVASARTLKEIRNLNVRGRLAEVGIALHVGDVMYGNVGTDERLDFTVIGRAVNEAARLQALSKKLGHPVLASASFAEPIRDRFYFAGAHPVAGFDAALETYVPRW